jgi:NitT/TauT family transport system substrate-binding protein
MRIPGLFAVLFAVLCVVPRADAADALRVQLKWTHQTQFAGYYMAAAHGHFGAQNLAVTLLEGGPGIDTLGRLAAGEVDVAVGWIYEAVEARRRGADIVNIAQVFQRSALSLVCNRGAGINAPADIAGRQVGVWQVGDQFDVRLWLKRKGVAESAYTLVPQAERAADFIAGKLPCVTAMTYNEYWHILRSDVDPAQLFTVNFGEERLGLLEDGLYVRRAALEDPAFVARLARFLRATAIGWQSARENMDEAVAITMTQREGLGRTHQRRMLEAILQLMPRDGPTGLLQLDAFDRSVATLAEQADDPAALRAAAAGAWTHRVWQASGLGGQHVLTDSVRHNLARATDAAWFHALHLFAVMVFGLVGFLRAQHHHYNLWGALVLTLVPALGGGTLRDLLIGGDRHPPFIFQDPVFIHVVLTVVVVGSLAAWLLPRSLAAVATFDRTLSAGNAIALAVMTVVGAQVALMANLDWFWVPFCAALTAAGGGLLLDMVTGHPPRTFQGEPYEEIAFLGGLLLLGLLAVGGRHEHLAWLPVAAIALTMALVIIARLAIIRWDIRSWRPRSAHGKG